MTGGRNARRLGGDDGAVLMEFVLILPFLALVTCGLVDYGFAYRQENQLQIAMATAGRTVSQVANQPLGGRADYAALQTIASAMSGMKNTELVKVVIWRANTNSAPQCLNLTPSATAPVGTPGLCNVYSKTQVELQRYDGFPGTRGPPATCASTAWDKNWCPVTRDTSDASADLVGVYVEVLYTPFTRFITSNPVRISESAVYRLEPQD